MINKGISFAVIFFFTMLVISAVSATEDVNGTFDGTDNIISQETTDETILNNDIEKTEITGLSSKSFTDLNATINGNDNETIYLTEDYKYSNSDSGFKSGIKINRNLTIIGNGITIDGNNTARIFKIIGENVTIRGINFINGNANYDDGGAISGECTAINCNFTGNKGHNGGAMDDGTAINCSFSQNKASYYGSAGYNINAINCTFYKNGDESLRSSIDGGALRYGRAVNCTFINNCANNGGAIYETYAENCTFISNCAAIADYGLGGAADGNTLVNCLFINNSAYNGGAIFYAKAINCTFLLNKVNDYDDFSCTIINCTFITPTLNITDLTTYYNSGEKWTFKLTYDDKELDGFNTTIKVYQNDALVDTFHALTGEGWIPDLGIGTYTVELSLDNYTEVLPVNATLTITKIPTELTAENLTIVYNDTDEFIVSLKDIKGNPLAGFEITVDLNGTHINRTDSNGEVRLPVGSLMPKTYTAFITFGGDDLYNESRTTAQITVNKIPTKITPFNETVTLLADDEFKINYTLNPNVAIGNVTFSSSNPNLVTVNSTGYIKALSGGMAYITISFLENDYYGASNATVKVIINKKNTQLTAKDLTTVYNKGDALIITLRDSEGNPISGVSITVDLNGVKKFNTDKNGQVKVTTKALAPKTYNAKITFAGNDKYLNSAANVKVVVKKAKAKITAKKKTFKKVKKVKKYTITLKSGKNPIKKVQVTIKIGKKTFKAKTNNKGKATFKIKKLTKKGKYKAVIKFKGNKYYNKATKKVKITVK